MRCFLLRILTSSNTPILGIMVHYFMFKKIALSLCFTLFLGLLSACSPDGVLRLTKSESTVKNTKENTNNHTNDNKGIGKPVALPPHFDKDAPLPLGKTEETIMPNGLPALKPMKGVNVEALFADKLKDSDKRFERVENAVIDLKKEFEVYKPAIVRLAAVESDIQNLIKELEVVLQETPAQQPPMYLSSGNETAEATLNVQQITPQPLPPPDEIVKAPKARPPDKVQAKPNTPPNINKKPPPKTPVKQFKDSVALNFRIGVHSDKVRIAFDTNKKTPFNIDLDNYEKLLIVELPEARWEGKKYISVKDSKLFESINIESTGDNSSMIILSLKKDTKILQKRSLSPDTSGGYYRIYFDLKP